MPGRHTCAIHTLFRSLAATQVEIHWHLCDEKPRDSVPGRFGDIANSI